jgi:hypothetical protein
MPASACFFCKRTFKSAQAVCSHRAQYEPCRVAWDEYLERFGNDSPPQPTFALEEDIENEMDFQSADVFDGRGPSPLPDMDWQPVQDADEESLASGRSYESQSDKDVSDSGNSSDDSDECGESDASDHDSEHADQERPIDEEDEENQVVDYFEPAPGAIIANEEGKFLRLLNPPQQAAATDIHHPFANKEEFELGNWMHQSGLPMSQMDSFLKLRYVSGSFRLPLPV